MSDYPSVMLWGNTVTCRTVTRPHSTPLSLQERETLAAAAAASQPPRKAKSPPRSGAFGLSSQHARPSGNGHAMASLLGMQVWFGTPPLPFPPPPFFQIPLLR